MIELPEIEPIVKRNGGTYGGNEINNTRPISALSDRDETKVVKLTDWCRGNFISINIGRTLIKKKLLIGFRRHHVWWVCANKNCLDELLEYLSVEELLFDADNNDLVVDL